ncbi:bifunctional 3,4-dihydroxy-2-butanone-4-phosphate synthase/GTP cyclohydrolase II [Rhodococcus aetherivorans]|uniref:bifunctional 3,4-dihydroxy-2-butanone-4-phosphate synthase/GTP cyclohydrolase II n=1 Tax=Rhodococcus aetherivorans TaxID=191292 RepID=UPI000622C3C7|nr:bifunctional 3,4-dihydroxy-2-butanone-4-phosphate synthase/GTP cyclohydrolase II [Rhodococcus aetherivorans]AKE87977.1 GTP cyclohydrolase [Rhodococcus aetherivorans]
MMNKSSIDDVLHTVATGGIVAVVDDENRENEGDLIMAAQFATPEKVAFFLEYTSGFLCTAITDDAADRLELPLMVETNTESHQTAFLVSVDYLHGTSTGISAGDRAATIRALARPDTEPDALARPGHVMPLRARPGGVLERPGHTEAGVDLCRLAGVEPAALLCELVTADRLEMMRRPQIEAFAGAHQIPLCTIEDLARYRRDASALTRTGQARIPTRYGTFEAIAYRQGSGPEHLALIMGEPSMAAQPQVRVHSECLTGDVVGSLVCDCGPQFDLALESIARAGAGALIYLRGHEGRGIGLGHKLQAYRLQQQDCLDTVDANLRLGLPVDSRDYRVAADILHDLGIESIELLTNNPDKIAQLERHGVTVSTRRHHQTCATDHNVRYLMTKRDRMGHLLSPTVGANPLP